MDDVYEGDFLYSYNERLEAECVLRARSIFDDFVCPESGLTIHNSQRHLIVGIKKLWSLTMEMKRFGSDIHARLCLLPLTFMLVLLNILEAEYAAEETGKMEVDSGTAEALLQMFYEAHDKLPLFQKRKDTRTASRAVVLYLRHLVNEFGAGSHIKAFAHTPLIMESGRLKAPFRSSDLQVVLKTMRHFRDQILKKYNRGPVKFSFYMASEVLDIMEPTRAKQLEIADTMNAISLILFAISSVFLMFILLAKGVSSFNDFAKDPQTMTDQKAVDPNAHPLIPEGTVVPTQDDAAAASSKGATLMVPKNVSNQSKVPDNSSKK